MTMLGRHDDAPLPSPRRRGDLSPTGCAGGYISGSPPRAGEMERVYPFFALLRPFAACRLPVPFVAEATVPSAPGA
jgi:hypothetical protein